MPLDDSLRQELVGMAREDQHARETLAASGGLSDPGQWQALRAVNEPHAARLWEILDDYERWPGISLVGEDGAHAAWLLAQHAMADPGLQRRCLELLEVAVEVHDAPAAHYAYLLDRVRMADGRDQRFGTQFVDSDDGRTVQPWPIEEPGGVDERRERLGLPTLAVHTRLMQEHYAQGRAT
ncbi:MAG: DUF6624 domain-containing protein [Actinomycetota bacterium]